MAAHPIPPAETLPPLRPQDDPALSLQAVSGFPLSSAESLYALAHHLYRQGRYVQALSPFACLVTLNPYDVRFHQGLGACKQMLRRHEEALRHYGVASMLDLTDPAPLLHAAECLLALGRRADARQRLELALGQLKAYPRHAACAPRVRGLLALLAANHAASASSH